MKNKDKNLQFLKNTISSIQYARFYAETELGLELPNNVVKALKVDDEGYVYFTTNCTSNFVSGSKISFYANLVFSEKNNGAKLNVSGKAEILTLIERGVVFIRMKMMNIEYTPTASLYKQNSYYKFINTIYGWLFPARPQVA